jgi:anti-sigma regulatory factor (Ser/Thr protein kinase)
MGRFWQKVDSVPSGTRVIFDFSRCRELHAVGMILIAGAIRVLASRGASSRIDAATISTPVMDSLRRSGCGAHLKVCDPLKEPSLFRHDLSENSAPVIAFLKDQWLSRAGITMSDLLQKELIGKVWEIYANAFEHGQSQVGVFTCGEQLHDGSMQLVVGDFGVGIPHNAREALKKSVSGSEAMEWAFQPGTTTLTGTQRHPRGLGLTLLKNLVELNDGQLDLYSHTGHSCVTSVEQSFRDVVVPFAATIVNLRIFADGKHYVFISELPDQPEQVDSPWV